MTSESQQGGIIHSHFQQSSNTAIKAMISKKSTYGLWVFLISVPFCVKCLWYDVKNHHGASHFRFVCRWFTETQESLDYATLHITVCPPDTSLSQELPLRHLHLFRWRTRFCVTRFLTALLICLCGQPVHQVIPTVSLLESHDPSTLSLVHHRIDPNIPAVTVLHEMLQI